MPKNPKYDSSRDRTNYTFHPGRRFTLQWDTEPGPCYLFALDERQAAMLRKMVQVFPKYHWVWGLPSPRKDWDAATWQLWEDISTFVDELEVRLVSGCDLNEWLKQQRMLTAAIVGEAVDLTDPAQLSPDEIDYTTIGLRPTLEKYLRGITPDPAAGDTIMTSLQKIADNAGGGQSLQDLIDAIENTDFVGAGVLDDLRDFLEILTFLKLLFGAQAPATFALGYWDKIKLFRYFHNDLTLKAYQATALKGIQYGITPFEKDGAEYSGEDQGILEELEQIPWLTDVISKYLTNDPIQIVRKISYLIGGELGVISKVIASIVVAWDWWYNKWINLVGDPQPVRTLTGVLTQISDKLVNKDEDYGTTGLSASLFGMLQGLSWTQVSPQDEIDNPGISTSNQLKVIADAISALDADMPQGETWPNLFGQIAANIANIKLSCSCGGGGCGTCGGTDPPTTPGVEGDPPPDGWVDPPDGVGTPEYQSRKCKISNMIWDGVHTAVSEFETTNVFVWITDKVESASTLITDILLNVGFPFDLGLSAIGWLSNLIVAFIGNIGVDLTDLKTSLETYQSDLVCSLYSATEADIAIDDFAQVLTDNGATLAQTTVIKALIPTEGVNALFFSPDETSDEFEAALDGYVGTVNCSDCEGCQSVIVTPGIVVNQTANTITVQSVLTGNLHQIGVYWNADETSPGQLAYCGAPGASVTDITSTNNLVGGVVQDNPDNTTIDNFHLYPPNSNLPTFPYNNVGRITFTFNVGQSGTVTIAFNQP